MFVRTNSMLGGPLQLLTPIPRSTAATDRRSIRHVLTCLIASALRAPGAAIENKGALLNLVSQEHVS